MYDDADDADDDDDDDDDDTDDTASMLPRHLTIPYRPSHARTGSRASTEPVRNEKQGGASIGTNTRASAVVGSAILESTDSGMGGNVGGEKRGGVDGKGGSGLQIGG